MIRLINYAKIAIYFAYAHNISENIFSHKIGGASEKKIEQALFFPLGLHYLCKNYLFMEKDEIQKLTYSEAVAELEKIVREMQSDACSIDNLSRLTSRSLELLKVCKAKLLSTDEELKKILAELEA